MIHQDDWDAMTWQDRYYATRDEACRVNAIDEFTLDFEHDWVKDDDELRHYVIKTSGGEKFIDAIMSIVRRVGDGTCTDSDAVAISELVIDELRTAARNRAETLI